MNIFYYDPKHSYEELHDVCALLKTRGIEVIAIPNDCQLIIDASAETLLQLSDKIVAALNIIKEERPEEFKKAMKMRQYDRFREVMKKMNEKI
jgi:purine-nucleoside phosphorylase